MPKLIVHQVFDPDGKPMYKCTACAAIVGPGQPVLELNDPHGDAVVRCANCDQVITERPTSE